MLVAPGPPPLREGATHSPPSPFPQFTRNQRVQMLSPFEVDTLGPLFSNIGPKLKHKIEDNFWDVAPSVLFFVLLVTFVKAKRQDMLVHHRD